MPDRRILHFEPFRLDLGAGQLWRDTEAVRLTAKASGVLCYLVEHAGQLLSKETLTQAVWAMPYVSEAALTVCIHEIRRALGDTAQSPQFVETVRGRGYRFVAAVTLAPPSPGPAVAGAPTPEVGQRPGSLVGRAAELARLEQWWRQAQQGARQFVFITGEAGIGKSRLVDAFVASALTTEGIWLGRGQCVEQYGAGEAYLPLLEALGQLGQAAQGGRFLELLQQRAPSWLLQLPALVPAADWESLQRRTGGTTRERMLRELAEVLEALTSTQPLILVLEDLHWSDISTVEWLDYMARRRAPARLLVLSTYRPVEAIVRAHPVHAVLPELQLHGQCAELPVGYLSADEVTTYLARRFGAGVLPEALSHVLYQRTDGNPLFLGAVVDELVRQDLLSQREDVWELVGDQEAMALQVPESLRHLIERQIEQLANEEQALLEAASVAGVEFAAATVAAAVAQDPEEVETHCAALGRRGQFLQVCGTTDWPDGTISARYEFRHALFQEVVYDRVPVSRRMQWHRLIGGRLEVGYGTRARESAVELAGHFVRGRDVPRAVQYLQYAGEQAVQRSAPQEALQHLTQGLELLCTLPETPRRAQQELDLRILLGPALIATRSQGAPEVEQTYARARALCAQIGETTQLLPTLQGLCDFYRNRGALSTARELGEQLLRLAPRLPEPSARLEAHVALGTTLFHLGEYAAARSHLEQGSALIEPTGQRVEALRRGVAPGVRCLTLLANTLWCLGYPAQAAERSQQALGLAQALDHPYSLAMAQHFAAFLHHRRREVSAVLAQADNLLSLATTQGFPLYIGYATCYRGWALALQEQGESGLAQIRQGLETLLATGLELSRPLWLVLLAEVSGHVGQVEAGLRLLGEALEAFAESGRGDMLAEAYRLRGELLLQSAGEHQAHGDERPCAAHGTLDGDAAAACFHQALEIAHRQQAKSWELRAALSLSRLWRQQGKGTEASQLLAEVYGRFTEGFDTVDLQQARELLDALRHI